MNSRFSQKTVSPIDASELSTILKTNSDQIVVIGSGSSQINVQPDENQLFISTSKLTSELSISVSNQTVTISSGISIEKVNERLEQENLTVPALARFRSGTVGGRLASVSSSPKPNESDGWIQSLLGLTVVLPNGDIVRSGGECIKDVAGYDLRHLFTGCRGVTGIIVSAIFRCYPLKSPSNLAELPFKKHSPNPAIRRLFDPTNRVFLID